jgi:hypothetical protein
MRQRWAALKEFRYSQRDLFSNTAWKGARRIMIR